MRYNGQKFGRLTVIRNWADDRDSKGYAVRRVLARCDCGESTRPYVLRNLTRGKIKSCGCLRRDTAKRTSYIRNWTGNSAPDYMVNIDDSRFLP